MCFIQDLDAQPLSEFKVRALRIAPPLPLKVSAHLNFCYTTIRTICEVIGATSFLSSASTGVRGLVERANLRLAAMNDVRCALILTLVGRSPSGPAADAKAVCRTAYSH